MLIPNRSSFYKAASIYLYLARALVLILSEDDVRGILDIGEAIEAIEKATIYQAEGRAFVNPRNRIYVGSYALHAMSSAIEAMGVAGLKAYLSTPSRTVFAILLYSLEKSELIAIIEGDILSRIRTGAASAVATKHLARRGSSTLGIIGSGRQAYTQATAISHVIRPDKIYIYSPNREHSERLASKLSDLGLQARVAGSHEEVMRRSDVISTATNSREPFIRGEWVVEGVHINLVGSNHPSRSEAHPEVFSKAGLVVTDSKAQAEKESGDLLNAVKHGVIGWDRIHELWEVVSRRIAREGDEEVTIFKSHGIALWDIAVAKIVYDKARREGAGREIEFRGYWEDRVF
jgi:ornithine cyclodeaminase/alanine dehydrogenase-like protein (mu-crystallin family)